MLRNIKRFIKETSLYQNWKNSVKRRELKDWEKTNHPRKGPLPHLLKQFTVKDYASRYNCSILIETGTFEGDMVAACAHAFSKVYSIELDDWFFKKATNRFRNHSNVKILQGDSGKKIVDIRNEIDQPAVFWLDGHYSAGGTAKNELDTPIAMEIDHIFNHKIKKHVILIDDARCFDGTNDYPKLDKFVAELHRVNKSINVTVYNDIIRIVPVD